MQTNQDIQLPTVMEHTFAQVPKATIPRSSLNRSWAHKTTMDEGYLVPCYIDEVLPGDTFNVKTTIFARLSTPKFPIMDNVYLDVFYFFVPWRIIWDNFEKQNGQQDNPGDSTDFLEPQVPLNPAANLLNSYADYFGMPIGEQSLQVTKNVSAGPFRSINRIYNDHFKDENLINNVVQVKDDGPDSWSWYSSYGPLTEKLLRRGKRHDYFTSCLPFLQKGPQVTIPLGTSAPVVFPSNPPVNVVSDGNIYTNGLVSMGSLDQDTSANLQPHIPSVPLITGLRLESGGTLLMPGDAFADLSAATAASINLFRLSFQTQMFYEMDARGGTRYTEVVAAHFQVSNPDMRLQRSEYLGGGTHPLSIHVVPQTSETATTPQGNLAAFGTLTAPDVGFVKSFTEHGWLIGLMSIRADLTYQQGLDKMFTRRTRVDRYWPAFAALGEQAVLNQEIMCTGITGPGGDDQVFGYQEHWGEYKYRRSMITGQMRTGVPTSFDVWHLSQFFGTVPTLNQTFIEERPPISRVVQVETSPHFIVDIYHKQVCARPMPVYTVPGLLTHL